VRKLLSCLFAWFLFLNSATIALAEAPGADEIADEPDASISATMLGVTPAPAADVAPVMFVEPAPKTIMEWVALVVGGATALAAFLRALSMFIMWFATKTKTDADNKLASFLERTADLVGKIPAIVGGILTPKKAVIAKATKLGMVKADDNGPKAA